MQRIAQLVNVLAALGNATSIRIVGWAGRDWQHADLGCCHLVAGGSGRGLGRGNCTGEDESDDESADEVFHSGIPLKLYLRKKFFLDNQMR
jgi:hypothetical protein